MNNLSEGGIMSCTCIPGKFLCREAVRAWELDMAKDKLYSPIKYCSDEHIDGVVA